MGKQPPQRTTTHRILTGRHRHPHRINRHNGRRAKKRFLQNTSEFSFQFSDPSFHSSKSCSCFTFFAILMPRFIYRQNSRLGMRALQSNSRCMNTHLPTCSHPAPLYNILSIDIRDETFNNNMTLHLGTSPLPFAAAPRRAIATSTTCIFRGPTLTPRHHHYLPHNLNPHGRCHSHHLHPPIPRHTHRHTLTHNHNHFNHHLFCPILQPLH